MVSLHCPTQRLKQTQIPIYKFQTQWESVLMSVSVQCEHLSTIITTTHLFGLGVGQCEHTIKVYL